MAAPYIINTGYQPSMAGGGGGGSTKIILIVGGIAVIGGLVAWYLLSRGPEYETKTGWDYPNNDIEFKEDAAFTECPKLCNKATGCVGYITATDKGKGCWLKSKLAGGKQLSTRTTYYKPGTTLSQ